MQESNQKFKKPSYKGNSIEVRLNVFSDRRFIYYMFYNFIDPESGEVICIDTTKCCFVDENKKPIRIPNFFLEALKNVKGN